MFSLPTMYKGRRPAPRGRRLWLIALATLALLLSMGVATLRSARTPTLLDDVLPPTDPGVPVNVVAPR